MPKTGLFVGKFMPPHIGHIHAILDASTRCDHLIVLVCFEPNITSRECTIHNLPDMPLALKVQWLTQELSNYPNITILSLDESGMPPFPHGWECWANAVKNVVGEPIHIIFGSEINYTDGYAKYFPESTYYIQDADRQAVNISSTAIRNDLNQYLDYIIPSARKYFVDFLKKNS
ncbi:MAG: adenylyltransferase/cytidyltransferase family protein [Clostridia bacterium]|nr:adenylyltransferase/cytidyltransferase family protein [Clostridia bacterium]